MGLAMLPLPHALPLLESGALARVLREWYAETRPLSIYYTSRKLVPAKVRVFVDYIVQEFQASGQVTDQAKVGRPALEALMHYQSSGRPWRQPMMAVGSRLVAVGHWTCPHLADG